MTPRLIGNTTEELVHDLRDLKLSGMADSLQLMADNEEEFKNWPWNDRVRNLIDGQIERRRSNRIAQCLRNAKLRYPAACMEELAFLEERGLSDELLSYVSLGEWAENRDNLVVMGAAGSGKTYLGCAIGVALCHKGISVRYTRMDDLLRDLSDARVSLTYEKVLKKYAASDVLIVDEFLLSRPAEQQTTDLLALTDKRYMKGSLMLCTQYPVDEWMPRLCFSESNRAQCESILDRIVHNARFVKIDGDVSMRERMRHIV